MRHRVFVYITRDAQLLLLDRHDGHYTQPQIPGGTVRAGEAPEAAALREAREETGLGALELVRCLGCFERDLTDIGRDETITAWFFHLRTSETTPLSWHHFESDPSEGGDPVKFRLYWVPVSQIPALGGIDSAMLRALRISMTDLVQSVK